MPLVSVIIPTYQRAAVLGEAIESVLAQTFTDYELIVVDDGSTDGTLQVVEKYKEKITFLHQPNRGVSAARNLGIQHSRGQLIAFLDSDDLWLPDKLSNQVPLFQAQAVGLVFGDIRFFSGKTIQRKTSFDLYPPRRGKIFGDLFARNFIPASTVVVRKACLETTGLFEREFEPCEDYHLWMRILQHWEADFCPQPAALYRVGSGQASGNAVRAWTSLVKAQEALVEQARLAGGQLSPQQLYDGLYKRYLRLAVYALKKRERKIAFYWLDRFRLMHRWTTLWLFLTISANLPYFVLTPLIYLGYRLAIRQEYAQN